MTSAIATVGPAASSIVYRGVPYEKKRIHQPLGATRQGAPLLTYRGVSHSTGSAGSRSQPTPIAQPQGRVIELQFLGNRYRRTC